MITKTLPGRRTYRTTVLPRHSQTVELRDFASLKTGLLASWGPVGTLIYHDAYTVAELCANFFQHYVLL
jgi:hypothetical protein